MATNLNERLKVIALRSAYHAAEPKKPVPAAVEPGSGIAAFSAAGIAKGIVPSEPTPSLRA